MRVPQSLAIWSVKGLFAVFFALIFARCLAPAEERAERDLEVGKAQTGGVEFAVVDGLAAVRRAVPGALVLWGSAPALELRAKTPATGSLRWTIELLNCLPDLELTAETAGRALPVELLPSELPTRKHWAIELPPRSDVLFRFAPPDASARQAFKFAVLSDVQEAIDRLSDIHQKLNAEPGIRFLLGAGDLTQQGTRQQLELYQDLLRSLNVPYFTTLGNHELGQNPTLWHEYFGRGNFRFTFRGVQLSLLDSASATIDPTVYGWLDGWLDEGRERVHVVAMHIPPTDPIGVRNGSFASRNEAAKLLTRLANGRVDLTLYGHIHSYYEFHNANIPAYISGGGGAIPERFDNMGRHFLVVEVAADAGVLAVRVVRVD